MKVHPGFQWKRKEKERMETRAKYGHNLCRRGFGRNRKGKKRERNKRDTHLHLIFLIPEPIQAKVFKETRSTYEAQPQKQQDPITGPSRRSKEIPSRGPAAEATTSHHGAQPQKQKDPITGLSRRSNEIQPRGPAAEATRSIRRQSRR